MISPHLQLSLKLFLLIFKNPYTRIFFFPLKGGNEGEGQNEGKDRENERNIDVRENTLMSCLLHVS